MKVLKRPMFKYGGDVKRQGIMHGMNGLRNGGVATTMADATGMANGGIMRQRYENAGPVIPNFYENEMSIAAPKTFENMTLTEKLFRPAPKETSLFRKIAGPATKTGQEVIEEKRVASLLKPNEVIDQETLVENYPQEFPTQSELAPYGKVLTGDAKKLNEQEQFLATEGGDKSKMPRASKQKTDASRLERIYNIMGVDDAKKDAVYNALIDLSQGQGIDTKDISGSINRAIGALSKRADKVTELKDKAKGALASGTITEMFRDKGSNYGKVARELVEAGVYKTYPEALKAITKVENDDIGKAIAAFGGAGKAGGGKINDKIVSGALATNFAEDYRGDLGSKKEVEESIAKGTFTDVLDIVEKNINVEPGDKSKDGLYKVGLKVVRVTNGKPSIAFNF
tara:strand:- start:89 stop:1282 length:1194 start_codon:yes stop_codon:yes gene_type:complete